MMKKLLLISCPVALLMLLAAGCSDDECSTCPEVVQEALMMAEVRAYAGEIQFGGYIFSLNGRTPEVDSVKLEGIPVEMELRLDAAGTFYSFSYWSGGLVAKPADWVSGDIVLVEIFTPDGKCEARCSLLDEEEDEPQIIEWATSYPYDTVDVSTATTIDWHPVDGADYYYVLLEYEYDSAGTYAYRSNWFEVHDTTYTIPASYLSYNGNIACDLGVVSGPSITSSGGNITGGIVRGYVMSTNYEYFRIYVGTGDPYPAGAGEPNDEEPRTHRTITDAALGVIKR